MPMMNNSDMSDDWIRRSCLANPIKLLANGNLLTCPVRLSWPNVFKRGKPPTNNPQGEGKFGAVLLFPPQQAGVDYTPMINELNKVLAAKFADKYVVAQTQSYAGVHTPFRDQGVKANFDGYTPGSFFITCTSNQRFPCCDPRTNPIVDESRVYPGVWAICALNVYDFGINPPQPKKGVSFGMRTMMIIADDKQLGGGGGNPQEDFAGVQVTAATNVAAQFGLGGLAPGMPAPIQTQVYPAGPGPGGMTALRLEDVL